MIKNTISKMKHGSFLLSEVMQFSLTHEAQCLYSPTPAGEAETAQTASALDVANETQLPTCISMDTA